MIQQKLRKVGNSYVVTIPKEEIARRQLREGQLVAVEVCALEVRPVLAPDLRAALERDWEAVEPALRYLADR